MRLSILILTVPPRANQCSALLHDLNRQIRSSGAEAEIVVNWDNFETPYAEKRNQCVSSAEGDYVCFVDDDDFVDHRYVSRILYAAFMSPDYIGFQLQLYERGKPAKPTFHSLRYEGWYETGEGYFRDVSHLNPVKRELALQVPFEGGYGEDRRWAQRMRPLLDTERYIHRVMYHYQWNPDTSLTAGDRPQGYDPTTKPILPPTARLI